MPINDDITKLDVLLKHDTSWNVFMCMYMLAVY